MVAPARRARPTLLRANSQFYASSSPDVDELDTDARLFANEREVPIGQDYPRVHPALLLSLYRAVSE